MADLITFEIDLARRIRRQVFRGVITEAILFSAYNDLISQPDFDPTMADLADMTQVERLEISTKAVRQLVSMFEAPELQSDSKLAIVAASDHVFGMARMYETLSSHTSEHIRVFRDMAEAEAWLDS